MPPACALPCSWSPSAPPRPKLYVCMFHVASVKPRPYDQSCIRLCIANRFARAASMSLRCGEVNVVAGLHLCWNHWFVHGYVYSRSGSGRRRLEAGQVPDVALPLVRGDRVVAARRERRERRRARGRQHVPRQRRRVVEHQRAVGRGQPAPAHARVGAGVVLRRRVREHRPGRIVGQVVDEPFADEHLTGLGVDERGESVVALEQRRLPRQADAVARRRHRDQPRLGRPVEPAGVEHRPAAPLAGVADRARAQSRVLGRGAHRRCRAHVAGAGDVRVGRERGRHVGDPAVPHADRDQAVAAGGHAVERLAQQHRMVRGGHDLEVACRRRVDAEQREVARDPLARGRRLVGRQPGGEISRLAGRHCVRRAEAVPRDLQSGGQRSLAPRRRYAPVASVDVRWSRVLPLEAGGR